jgi:2,3-bisphosphoglycerate-independent phosphoglycerate mutase
VEKAYRCLVAGEGERAPDAAAAVRQSYAAGKTDEFVLPTAIGNYAGMADGDGVLMANFRADRVREILLSLLDPGFAGFQRPRVVKFAAALGMTEASTERHAFIKTLFSPEDLKETFGEVVSRAGLTQLRIAETEKYAHVTFFLNGGREDEFPGESRILVPSPKVATYDLKPEMSAFEVTDELLKRLDKFDLVILNFANPDMVGHTGVVEAGIKAVETVDKCCSRIIPKLLELGGKAIVTADHGNCELMRNADGSPNTAHTTNLVHCIYVANDANKFRVRDGILADVAPTLLFLLGMGKPSEMTGQTLLSPAFSTA